MPRPTPATSYPAQIGYVEMRDGYDNPCRAPQYRDVKHVMSCDCRYSATTEDPRCGAFPDLGLSVCPHKKMTTT